MRRAVLAFVRFDERQRSALLDHDEHAGRGRDGGRRARDEAQMQRARERGAAGDADHRAVAHEGGVDGIGGVVAGGLDRADLGNERMSGGERLGERDDLEPRRQLMVGGARSEMAVDEGEAADVGVGEGARGRERHGDGLGRRLLGERRRLAHQGAQVGVLPLLDPPVRQAAPGEEVEGGVAQAHHLPAPGQRCLHGREALDQRLLGGGADDLELGVHRLTRPPAGCTRHSRSPRARARARARRSARCGRSP